MSHPSKLAGHWGVVDQRALDAFGYWLVLAAGADFVTVDGSNGTKDEDLITAPKLANEKFAAVIRWLRARTTLPIWWMEMDPDVRRTRRGHRSTART